MLQRLAFILIPLNVFFDISLIFFEKGGVIPLIRAVILISVLVAVIFKYYSRSKHYKVLLLFVVYVLIIVLLSSDIALSFKVSIKVLSAMLAYVIGFNLINTIGSLQKLNKSIVIVYILLLLNYLVSSLFGLGESVYTKGNDFMMGNMSDNWNLFTYPVLLAPLALHFYKKNSIKKLGVFTLAFVNAVIVVLSLKRIAILGLVSGNLINAFFVGKVRRLLKSAIIILIIAAASFPLYADLLSQRVDARSKKFEKGSIETEGRYLETFYVWTKTLSFDDPVESLFGMEGFNSVGNYANGSFGERQLHVDYNLIVNTIGLFGLLLYFLIFTEIYRNFRYFYRRVKGFSNELNRVLRGTFLMLLFTPFLTSFGGQMYAISFRMIIFIYLGALVGIYYKQYTNESSDRLLS